MSTDLAKLVVSLEAETARYQKELEKARGQLGKFEKDATAAVARIAQAAGAAVGAAAVGFSLMAKAAIDNADRLSKLSQSTGIATEALSQLEYAADLSGVSSDQLTGALSKLARTASEAAEGAKGPAEAYRRLGVSVADASGKMRPAEQLLGDVAQAFSEIEDGPAKAALAMDIFGKSGAELIPFLNLGREGLAELRAEAHAFGLTVDGEAAKAAEEFNDNLSRLQAAARGVANLAAQELAPSLAMVTDELVAVVRESDAVDVAATSLRVTFEAIAVLGANVAFVFQTLGREAGAAAATFTVLEETQRKVWNAISRADTSGVTQAIEEAQARVTAIRNSVREETAASRQHVDAFSERILGAHDAAEKVRATIAKWAPAIAQAKSGPLAEQQRVMQGLASAYQAGEFGAVGTAAATRAYEAAVAKALPTIGKKRVLLAAAGDEAGKAASKIKGLTDAIAEQAATLGLDAQQVELYRLRVAGASGAQLAFAGEVLAAAKAFEEQKAALAEGKQVTEQMRTPAEALSAEYARLSDLLARGAINQETFNRAVVAAQGAFVAADPAVQKAIASYTRLNDLLKSTPTGKLEEQRSLMLDLTAAYERGELGVVGSTEAMERYSEAAQTALGTLPDATKQNTDLMQELTAEAARNMQGALADFLFDPFDGGVEGMVDSFAKALQRMVAEAAAAKIFEALGVGAGGTSGGTGGIFDSLLGAAVSYYTGTQAPAPVAEASFTAIPGRASGGSMRAGRPYWTGEQGPELVFPGATSRILSAPDSAEMVRGQGARQVTQNFHITTPDPNAFRASERQVARRARLGLQG